MGPEQTRLYNEIMEDRETDRRLNIASVVFLLACFAAIGAAVYFLR
jgi:hypothetical protein